MLDSFKNSCKTNNKNTKLSLKNQKLTTFEKNKGKKKELKQKKIMKRI